MSCAPLACSISAPSHWARTRGSGPKRCKEAWALALFFRHGISQGFPKQGARSRKLQDQEVFGHAGRMATEGSTSGTIGTERSKCTIGLDDTLGNLIPTTGTVQPV